MGLFMSINIAATGMSAERLRADVIANNIANATTTRTEEGGPYRRQTVVLAPRAPSAALSGSVSADGAGLGVRVLRVAEDMTQGRMVYDPAHPDAIQSGPNKGYVEYPNVNIVNEMVGMISANRAYEANSAVIQGARQMFASALEIASRRT